MAGLQVTWTECLSQFERCDIVQAGVLNRSDAGAFAQQVKAEGGTVLSVDPRLVRYVEENNLCHRKV